MSDELPRFPRFHKGRGQSALVGYHGPVLNPELVNYMHTEDSTGAGPINNRRWKLGMHQLPPRHDPTPLDVLLITKRDRLTRPILGNQPLVTGSLFSYNSIFDLCAVWAVAMQEVWAPVINFDFCTLKYLLRRKLHSRMARRG